MAQFIKLNESSFDGVFETWLNVDHIKYFNRLSSSTAINYVGGCSILVNETPEEILALIEGKEAAPAVPEASMFASSYGEKLIITGPPDPKDFKIPSDWKPVHAEPDFPGDPELVGWLTPEGFVYPDQLMKEQNQ